MRETELEVKIVGIFARIAKISLGLRKFRNLSEISLDPKFSLATIHSEKTPFRYHLKFSLA